MKKLDILLRQFIPGNSENSDSFLEGRLTTFIDVLQSIDSDINYIDIADIFWLAEYIDHPSIVKSPVKNEPNGINVDKTPEQSELNVPTTSSKSNVTSPQHSDTIISTSKKDEKYDTNSKNANTEPVADLSVKSATPDTENTAKVRPFPVPAIQILKNQSELIKSLKPLRHQVLSKQVIQIDETATANRAAELGLWVPVLQAAKEKWLEVSLIFDQSQSTVIWEPLINDLRKLVTRLGAFRDIKTWRLVTSSNTIKLYPWDTQASNINAAHRLEELNDPAGRRLIIVASDCLSQAWHSGLIFQKLQTWGQMGPVALLQLLPRYAWEATALSKGKEVAFHLLAGSNNIANSNLMWQQENSLVANVTQPGTTELLLPVITLDEPDSLSMWAEMLVGRRNIRSEGFVIPVEKLPTMISTLTSLNSTTPSKILDNFEQSCTKTTVQLAVRLACLEAFNLPLIRIIQHEMLPKSDQKHLVELFLSGLLYRLSPSTTTYSNPDSILYTIRPELRKLLREALPVYEQRRVINVLTQFVAENAKPNQIKEFLAYLPDVSGEPFIGEQLTTFAKVSVETLRRWGGDWSKVANQYEVQHGGNSNFVKSIDRRRALCIGIGEYTDPGMKNRNLHYAPADAQAIARELADPGRGGFEVVLRDTPETTTWKQLRTDIEDLFQGQGDGTSELALLFISTHGVVFGHNRTFYLLPSDAQVTDWEYPGEVLDLYELVGMVNKARVKNIVIWLDVCHASGAGEVFGKLDFSFKPNINIFIGGAARSDYNALQLSQTKHGVYTECLLKAFEKRPDEGDGAWLSVAALQRHIEREIDEFNHKENRTEDKIIQFPSIFHSSTFSLPVIQNPAYSLKNAELHKQVGESSGLDGYHPQSLPPSNYISYSPSFKQEKNKFAQAIRTLTKDLGIYSLNRLWEIMGVSDYSTWYKRSRGEIRTYPKHINQIIEALREAGYKVTAQHEKMLKEAVGMVVTIEEINDLAVVSPQINISNITQPQTANPEETVEKMAERDYLEAVVRTYRHLQTGYTELSSAATFDQPEKRRQRQFFELLCQRYPPSSKESNFFFDSGEDNPAITGMRGSIREQVASLPAGAILGAPGAGKTTTLKRLTLHYAQIALKQEPAAESDAHAGKIPVLVSLGGYRGEGLLSYMRDYLGQERLDYPHSHALANQLKAYLEQGRLLVLFDALNEVAEEYRGTASSQLKLFLNIYCSERVKQPNSCLLTCREADYHKDFNELPRLVLEPLNDQQIENLLTNWFSQDSAAVWEFRGQLAANGGLLRKQVRNPMLLSVILELYGNSRVLPRGRGELFEAFVRYLVESELRRWLDKNWLGELLPEQETENLAVETLGETNRQRLVESVTDLIKTALSLLGYAMLSDRSQGTEARLDWVFGVLPDPVVTTFRYRQKLKSVEQRVERELGEVLLLAQRAGLLILYQNSINSERDYLRFGHQLLQEYFAAVYLISEKTSPADWDRAIRSYDFDEVFPFVTDLATDPAQPIKRLVELDFELACRCAGLLPVGQLDNNLRQILIDRAIKLLQSNFGPDQNTAINALQYLKSSQSLIEFGLNHAESQVRYSVVEVLSQLEVKEAIPHFIPLLEDEDSEVRSKVVEVLSQLEVKEAIPYLTSLLQDKDSGVRQSVVWALNRLAAKEAIPYLIPLLRDKDSGVRYSVVEVLNQLEVKEAIPYLIPLLRDKDSGVRQSVVWALNRLAAKEAIPYLIPLLRDKDSGVRQSVIGVLSEIGDKSTVDLLTPMLSEKKDKQLNKRVFELRQNLKRKLGLTKDY